MHVVYEYETCLETIGLYLHSTEYPQRAIENGVLAEDIQKLEAEYIDFIHLHEVYISKRGREFSEYLQDTFKLSIVGSVRISRNLRLRKEAEKNNQFTRTWI